MKYKNSLLILLFSFLFTMNGSISAAQLTDYLIPTPQHVDIQKNISIQYHEDEFTQIANYLAQFNKSTWEKEADFHEFGEHIIKLSIHIDRRFKPQEYRLFVKDQSIVISSGSNEGLYYGIQTLRQLFAYALAEKQSLPELLISDFPAIERRGFMLDISRDKVPTMETLYHIVDLLTSWKVNELQLYTEHTFAYKNHKTVWENASPMTAEEISALQQYCNDRFIDLVPNQNSFGHFENWLKYKRYQPLAETVTDVQTIWGPRSKSSLDPTNPGSLELMKELYAELLPNFKSEYVNIGCDETVELGLGKSKAACDSLGKGRVYLDFLIKLNNEVNKLGKKAQFWGDIVLNHDSLIPFLPQNMTAMVWGYSSNFAFDTILPKFQKAGIRYYVCPGTATWCSITGKNEIAFENLKNAGLNAKKYNAAGFLVTNWGDYGHWQPLSLCYAPMMLGVAYGWNCDTTLESRLELLLNQYVFQDQTQNTGRAVLKLGLASSYAKVPETNNNIFYQMYRRYAWKWNGNEQTRALTVSNLNATEAQLDSSLLILEKADPQCTDREIVIDELKQATALAKHACHFGQARLAAKDHQTLSIPAAKRKQLAAELKPLIANHKKLWVVRNRKGGLDDSAEKFQVVYDYYLK